MIEMNITTLWGPCQALGLHVHPFTRTSHSFPLHHWYAGGTVIPLYTQGSKGPHRSRKMAWVQR